MNRSFRGILIVFLSLSLLGCAGSSSFMTKQSAPPTGPSPGKALVYFMRPSGMGFAIHFQIYHGKELIGLSQAKSYFTYECDPGTQLFLGMAENKHGLEAQLEANKTYVALTQVKMGAWKARMAFIPVNKDSEYWDKVEAYKTSLNYVVADKAQLQSWQAARKAKVDAVLDQSYEFFKTPEGQKYVVRLNKEDGR